MDAKDLEEKLSSHKVPDPNPEVRGQHLARARAAFMYQHDESRTPDSHATRTLFVWPSFLGGAAVGALVCLLLVVIALKSDFISSPPGITSALSSAEHAVSLPHEPSKPLELDSLEIHLLPAPLPAHRAPVVLELRQRDLRYTLISYVGQLVLVRLGATMHSFHTQRRPDGKLVLFADQQFKDGSENVQIKDLSVQVRWLGQE